MMKKFLVYALVLCIVLGFAGCAKKEKPPVAEKQSEDELMVYDLMEVFYSDKDNANCVVSDHAVATDKSFDLMGVVQYTDAENNSACLGFVRTESGTFPVKFGENGDLTPAKDSKLIYLGEGKVSFLLEEKETGEIYEYTVTYTDNEGNVKIDSDSKLLEK